ncbi:MAG: hypothetical protein U0794_07910 [Isosphaeraceae bacterium]
MLLRRLRERRGTALRSHGFAALMATLWAAPAVVQADEPAWSRQKAAERLDARQTWWSTWESAKREPETSCVACHTGMPFVLARSALDPANPGKAYDDLLVNVRKRVELWETDAPYYDFKARESRGTEAVLNALILATDDRRRHLTTADPSTTAALGRLWQTQSTEGERKGSWPWLQFGDGGYEPWESRDAEYFGTALGALAVGLVPGGPQGAPADRLQATRDYLRTFHLTWPDGRPQSLHNRLAAVWASTALDGILTPEQRTSVVDEVFARQREDGAWAIASLGNWTRKDGTPQSSNPDGYATGLAVVVLRRAGVAASDPRIKKAVEWLRANQEASTGAWPGNSVHRQRAPSQAAWEFSRDAATSFAILALTHPDTP